MPVIDVDRDAARDAAAAELSKPIYPQASLSERLVDWLNDALSRLVLTGSSLPGGWFTVAVLVLLVVAALVVATAVIRRTMGSRGGPPLYGDQILSAAAHRLAAEESAAQGDWAQAIRHRLRAIGRQLEEDGVLGPLPGRTAGELSRDAGARLLGCGDDLAVAATLFNDVTYGEQPGTEAGYRLISALDSRLSRRSQPAVTPNPAVHGQTWAPVR